jgi:hypothetical protein
MKMMLQCSADIAVSAALSVAWIATLASIEK